MIPLIHIEGTALCELMHTDAPFEARVPLDLLLSVSDYRLHTADYASRRLEACAELRRVTAVALQDTAGSVTVSDLEALHYPRLGIYHDHGGGIRTVVCGGETLTLVSANAAPISLSLAMDAGAAAMLMTPIYTIVRTLPRVIDEGWVPPSVACVAPASYAYTAGSVLMRHYGSGVWLQHEGAAAAAPY